MFLESHFRYAGLISKLFRHNYVILNNFLYEITFFTKKRTKRNEQKIDISLNVSVFIVLL